MVKCWLLILTLQNDIKEQIGYFNSCISTSNYVISHNLDVLMISDVPVMNDVSMVNELQFSENKIEN